MSTGMPLFTVVVTTFNLEHYIAQALASLQLQFCGDFEVLVVDDGSSDGTVAAARHGLAALPGGRLVTQANRGPGGARNTGISQARGRYIVFLDGDDWLETGALARFERAVATTPDAVFANRRWFNEKNRSWLDEPTFQSTSEGPVGPGRKLLARFAMHGKALRRQFLLDHALRFPEKMIWEDYPFSYGVLAQAQSIGTLSDCVYVARRRSVGTPSLTQQKRLTDFCLNSRFAQIEMCRRIVRESALGERFPHHDFDRTEFGQRLMVDIKYLASEQDPDVFARAFTLIGRFLDGHARDAIASVDPHTARVFQAILDADGDETRQLLRRARG